MSDCVKYKLATYSWLGYCTQAGLLAVLEARGMLPIITEG